MRARNFDDTLFWRRSPPFCISEQIAADNDEDDGDKADILSAH